MYAVIFKAVIADLDPSYQETAAQLRSRAMEYYGCSAFESYQDGDKELTISYWRDEQQIAKWKADELHVSAQTKGRKSWYSSYHVQVVKLLREYGSDYSGD